MQILARAFIIIAPQYDRGTDSPAPKDRATAVVGRLSRVDGCLAVTSLLPGLTSVCFAIAK